MPASAVKSRARPNGTDIRPPSPIRLLTVVLPSIDEDPALGPVLVHDEVQSAAIRVAASRSFRLHLPRRELVQLSCHATGPKTSNAAPQLSPQQLARIAVHWQGRSWILRWKITAEPGTKRTPEGSAGR